MNVVDLELTKEFRAGAMSLTLSGGGRYADLAQTYDASLLSTPAVPNADTIATCLRSSHDFRGAGGTFALEGGYAIGNTGVSVFCIGRGSLLYGVGRENASLRTTTTSPAGFVTTQALDPSASQDRVIPVAEIELGAEYALALGRLRLFARAALANQVWFGAGNASNNQTIAGTGTVLTAPLTQVADNHINLGLFSLMTTVAVQY